MENRPNYLSNTQIPRRKILELNYSTSNAQTFGRKNKGPERVNKQISILEDAFIQKIEMCERKIDQYFSKTNTEEVPRKVGSQTESKEGVLLQMNETFGREAQGLLDDSKTKTVVRQTCEEGQEYSRNRSNRSTRSVQRRCSSKKRFTYNYNVGADQIKTESFQPSKLPSRPNSAQRSDQLPTRIPNTPDTLNNSHRSSRYNDPVEPQRPKGKQNQGPIGYRENSTHKFQNIDTINTLTNQISERINRMMNSFK